jgi:hypothetical protein
MEIIEIYLGAQQRLPFFIIFSIAPWYSALSVAGRIAQDYLEEMHARGAPRDPGHSRKGAHLKRVK